MESDINLQQYKDQVVKISAPFMQEVNYLGRNFVLQSFEKSTQDDFKYQVKYQVLFDETFQIIDIHFNKFELSRIFEIS